MKYKKEDLIELTDSSLSEIYRENKNISIKLFKLKNGKFAVYKNGSNVYESISERNAKIEFILLAQKENNDLFESIFGNIFN